jgi:hypothetical protein
MSILPPTVRDGSRSDSANAGRSLHDEHPGAGVSVTETHIGRASSNRGSAKVTSGIHAE